MAVENWIIGLAIIGALDSLYTALQQEFPKFFQFCFDKGFNRVDCNEILHSKEANLFRVRNSWLGIVFYALMVVIYSNAPVFASVGADRLYLIGALIATAALIISYYLIYVQAKVIEKFCIFCLTSTCLITIITLMAWIAY